MFIALADQFASDTATRSSGVSRRPLPAGRCRTLPRVQLGEGWTSGQTVRVGSRRVALAEAKQWIWQYFDAEANRVAAVAAKGRPYAFPVYDRMDTGSGPNELNDGDLLAAVLLLLMIQQAGQHPLSMSRRALPEECLKGRR